MMETNPFRYFIPEHTEKLIVGSFPCFNGKDYGDWFYSGSGKNHFWRLLSDTVHMPVENKEQKMRLCQTHKIALTDIALKIERTKGNCSDANLKILEFNREGVDRCLEAGVTVIFFTGKFVAKNFHKLYPDLKLPSRILLSPSPAANIHIAGLKEFRAWKQKQPGGSPYEYRLCKYREMLA